MQTQTNILIGLTCPACKKITEKRIRQIPGVMKVTVMIESGEAVIESEHGVSILQIREVLKDTPYQIA